MMVVFEVNLVEMCRFHFESPTYENFALGSLELFQNGVQNSVTVLVN